MKKNLSYIYLVFLLVNTSQAQVSMDTIKLPEVRLMESRVVVHDIGMQIDVIKTESLAEGSSVDLASLINSSSSVYIKKYGALATPTFRGTSSSHTLVLWNGIPINSIANGISDLSGLYCHTFSDIFIVHGGDASIFGSGAVGGSLHLNVSKKPLEKNEVLFSSTRGSYGLSSQSISFSANNGKLTSKCSFYSLNHNNNFEFINITQMDHPLSINKYGKIMSNSQNLDLMYRLNPNTNYNFSYWNSSLDREVSQNMTTPFSDAKQYDSSKRLLFSLNHKQDCLSIAIKQAFLEEDFLYTEILKNIDSHYLAETHISDADIKLLKGNYLFNLGAAFTDNRLVNNNYFSNRVRESSLAAFYALQYRSEYLAFNTVLRKEWKNTFIVPFIPTLAFDIKFSQAIKLRAKYNRSFRSPTFNDRFWAGSGANGNSDLKPEDACNKEMGVDFKIQHLNLTVTSYNLHISDMILWQQIGGGSWMPHNIKKVFSRGIETSVNFKYRNMIFAGNYAFTKSTNEHATNDLDNTIGKQLRYVPLHKANASIKILEKNLQFNLINSYTGEVITSYGTIENRTLDSFFLTDISVKYKIDNFPISIQAKVKNLMNKSYVTYHNYPNPGREFLLTLDYIMNLI